MNIIKKIVAQTESGIKLDRWLKRHFTQLTFNHIQKLIRTGQLRVNGKRAQAQVILEIGDEIRLPIFEDVKPIIRRPIQSEVSSQDIQQFKNSIIFEDEDYIVINKPQGIAVQGGTNTHYHLDLILQTVWPEISHRPKIVHRLDRDTSGIIVFAKTQSAVKWLGQAFHDRLVQKKYLAVVVGKPAQLSGMIDASIGKMLKGDVERMTVTDSGNPAQTKFKVIKSNTNPALSYVEFMPITGRTHQIRVHAAHIGCPILGDGKYGGKYAHSLPKRTSICLHAAELSFTGSNGQPYHFMAPLPETFENILQEFLTY